MIRVTVKEIYELQKSVQATGEVHAIVGPKEAFSTDRFFVAWSRSVHGDDYYLAVYRDAESWKRASTESVVEHTPDEDTPGYLGTHDWKGHKVDLVLVQPGDDDYEDDNEDSEIEEAWSNVERTIFPERAKDD
jgi:hypothetical protein